MTKMGGKKIVVIVDMQNDFIDGALGSKEAPQIVEGCVKKVAKAYEDGDQVIFTRDTHYDDTYMNSEEGKNLPVVHCIEDSYGWNIASAFGNYTSNSVRLNKETFGSVQLGQRIAEMCARDKSIESVELCGLCTDICVISNALLIKAFNPNLPIYVDAACSAGVTPESHDTAIKAMEACQIHILNKGKEPWRE
ncbi:Nicotinamidase-related amidase [Butyrivibrio fibrisolvens DSM 3071]|uniref:nicotinamidase n=1 Tax=Butyrivibrio fibrisolvens DSM 3071 TaxID=1121131 RepID=A0A1M5SX69_BUTFI|nr:isochorismatase family cysteine hydrolase [Butyrivibrio fibrisolvens]SHH42980.1 Nicotinamidase-related amidase [Butyrivibrio fibrisolvens DSM 3071]